MSAKRKNVTFSLPVEYIEKLRAYAEDNQIPSMSAGVKNALDNLFKQIEKNKLYNAMKRATEDLMFMKDIDETMEVYKYSDAELLGRKNHEQY